MSIEIRGTEPSDLDAIHEIFSGENVIRGSLRLPHSPRELYKERLAPDDNWFRFVAVIDGQVVGFTEVETFPNPRVRHLAHLNMIGVRDDMQGKGIGTTLLESCIELADKYLLARRFYLEVWAESPAVRLYQKYGFEIEGRHVDYGIRDGEYQDMYTMARIKK